MPEGARIGLVGCGRWGEHILRDLRALGCEVTVVARSPESKARAEAGGAPIAGSVAELPEVDGVVVATPISTHAAVVEEALGLGVPVFVEKPLTNDLQAAERLAAEADGRLFVMDKWRYHPGVELLAELAAKRRAGPGHRPAHDPGRVGAAARRRPDLGARAARPRDRPRDPRRDPGAPERGRLPGRSRSACSVRVPGRCWRSRAAATSRRREVALVCEEGIAVLGDSFDDHAALFREGSEPERRPVSTELPLLRELRAFVEHLAGGPPPRSSAEDGVKVVRAISELRALAGLDS